MYEVVKIVNGYVITRMIGTHGVYNVILKSCKSGMLSKTFKTIKAASAFCETL